MRRAERPRSDDGGDGRGATPRWQLPLPALPAPLYDRHHLRHDRSRRKERRGGGAGGPWAQACSGPPGSAELEPQHSRSRWGPPRVGCCRSGGVRSGPGRGPGRCRAVKRFLCVGSVCGNIDRGGERGKETGDDIWRGQGVRHLRKPAEEGRR